MQINISKKQFKKFYKISSDIYNISIVLADFCSYHDDIEEAENIYPIIKCLKSESDKLLYDLTNIRLELEEKAQKI